jgi:hypothetical protein
MSINERSTQVVKYTPAEPDRMAASLPEPTVLAAAKDTLYPTCEESRDQYTVTETQFTQSTWGEWEIPADLHQRLAPYNTIPLTEGEPDLLGVGLPAGDVLNPDAATAPVTVIEAKGHNTDPSNADIRRGITQAHAHLTDVNLGYVAAPQQSLTESARALARELNVGVISVADAHHATIVEPARITGGGDFSTTIDAIRFQATTHRLTEGSFPLNHPKNFLGYVLALAADGETRDIYTDYVINAVSDGRRGALLLGLIDAQASGDTVTHLGAEVIRFARTQCGSITAALEEFDDWTGRSTRFTQIAPHWAQLARSVAMQYEPTQLIVEALEHLHRNGTTTATIDHVAKAACQINQPLTVEVFFAQSHRDTVLSADGHIDTEQLREPTVYKSGLHFQFKYHLYHIGVVTEGGTDDKHDILSNEWALEHSVSAPQ